LLKGVDQVPLFNKVAAKVHIFIQIALTSVEKEKCVKTLNYNNRRPGCR